MEFGQLIEYSMKKHFSWKIMHKNVVGKLPRPFSKKSKLSVYQQSKILHSLFLLHAKSRAIERYWNQAAYHLLLPHIKLFQKTRRGLELVSLSHFMLDFWRKIFLTLCSINWPNFTVWLPLLREMLDNMYIVIVC